ANPSLPQGGAGCTSISPRPSGPAQRPSAADGHRYPLLGGSLFSDSAHEFCWGPKSSNGVLSPHWPQGTRKPVVAALLFIEGIVGQDPLRAFARAFTASPSTHMPRWPPRVYYQAKEVQPCPVHRSPISNVTGTSAVPAASPSGSAPRPEAWPKRRPSYTTT